METLIERNLYRRSPSSHRPSLRLNSSRLLGLRASSRSQSSRVISFRISYNCLIRFILTVALISSLKSFEFIVGMGGVWNGFQSARPGPRGMDPAGPLGLSPVLLIIFISFVLKLAKSQRSSGRSGTASPQRRDQQPIITIIRAPGLRPSDRTIPPITWGKIAELTEVKNVFFLMRYLPDSDNSGKKLSCIFNDFLMEVYPEGKIATRIDRISTQAEEENLVFQLGGESDDSPEAVFEVSMEDAIREIGRPGE